MTKRAAPASDRRSAAGRHLLPWLAALGIGAASLAVAQSGPTPGTVAARPAAAETGPTWTTLTPSQQQALSPLRGEWGQIDGPRKQKWLEIADRMPSMAPAERERIQQRMTEWVRMSPAERGRARMQFQEVRKLPAETRQEQWEAYQALPPDRRQALAAKATQPARKPATASTTTSPPNSAVPATSVVRRETATSSEVKRNIVSAVPSAAVAPKAVAPTVVQARPGATTSLVTTPSSPPVHHQAGLPKVNAKAGFVDPATLLPKRGPQGAAAVSAASSPSGSTP